MLEALINQYGNHYFKAYSAGSMPNGVVHPMSLMTIKNNGIKPDTYQSKSWNVFDNQIFDLVITVCDNAAGEACPIYLNSAPKVHWGVEDPAKFKGSEEEIENEFQRVFAILAKRTHAMIEKYSYTKKLQLKELKLIGNLI
ncbi:arsenate reductase ArsC [Alphaproteobacteria bacterium]|nr:arsenate reductase ArsC [Alphaproteobacteria bacterium]